MQPRRVACREELLVEAPVQRRPVEGVGKAVVAHGVRRSGGEGLECGRHAFAPRVVTALDRALERDGLEHLAQPVGVEEVAARDRRHGRAEPWVDLDEVLGREALERLAQRGGADLVALRELRRAEPLTGRKHALDDVEPKCVLQLGRECRARDPICRHSATLFLTDGRGSIGE